MGNHFHKPMSRLYITAFIALLFIAQANTMFNLALMTEMAQLGADKANQLAKGEVKTQLAEFKTEFPVIFEILADGAGNNECEKIRVDCFSDCKFTFEGIKDLKLSDDEAYQMTDAIFSKCVAVCKELCPL